MKIAVASDSMQHLVISICDYLEEKGATLIKYGALVGNESDYVDAAREGAEAVSRGEVDFGVLFCNTGTGVSIIANKVYGVRAAFCVDSYSAKIAKLANNANCLVLSMRYTGEGLAKEIVDAFLETAPSTEPRRKKFHQKTAEIDELYRKRANECTNVNTNQNVMKGTDANLCSSTKSATF